ncbi:hypothetical protein [Roseivirga misakiensis]|uniref:Uncharacterized protein n=1 Tax=Roseivirga misakiensis TaxID=1563681 RepID=A0A1E5SZU4_9BACT|nr:hypothetical protein [Roseivirga misakiensis]OEK04626.1 hypothetical protein BFP71_14315 [Roseivirga misakiensis]
MVIPKINTEDLLLYIVSIGVLIFLAIYLNNSLSNISTELSKQSPLNDKLSELPEIYQVEQRYIYATRVLISNSARNNMSFMVGAVLSILGAMIIIRRVKTEASSLDAGNEFFKFNLVSNSPGLIITTLGCAIIVIAIASRDSYSITDSDLSNNPPNKERLDTNTDNLTTNINEIIKK